MLCVIDFLLGGGMFGCSFCVMVCVLVVRVLVCVFFFWCILVSCRSVVLFCVLVCVLVALCVLFGVFVSVFCVCFLC